MKMRKQTITNLKTILKFLVILPIIWFGTFGEIQILTNFVYFLNFLVCVTLFGILGAFDKIKEDLTKENIPNKYLYFTTWMIPVCIFVADGWIASAVLWFITWAISNSRFSEFLKENDKQDNDT